MATSIHTSQMVRNSPKETGSKISTTAETSSPKHTHLNVLRNWDSSSTVRGWVRPT